VRALQGASGLVHPGIVIGVLMTTYIHALYI
jgi:hypothetical protein